MDRKPTKKDIAKAYGKYAKGFTPKPSYFRNTLRAFLVGGLICVVSMWFQNRIISMGIDEKDAGIFTTITLVALAQLLTGLGVFDVIAKYAGAGVIVPITGFANSMVAPAIEYKKEGPVLGVGAKMFSIAGPVLVSGIVTSTLVGVLYWLIGFLIN